MSKKEDIVALYDKYVMKTYSQSLVLVKGKGTKVWDADGKVYLDFMAGISVCNVGHCHPHVVESIRNQAGTLIHVSNMFFNENQAKLAERLSSIALHGKCFFCNSGAEANEGLVKLARLWGHEKGKYQVITMKNSFHGRTLATAAATCCSSASRISMACLWPRTRWRQWRCVCSRVRAGEFRMMLPS